jgi:colanic acid biosynthesis glycosyl transferase WcaI
MAFLPFQPRDRLSEVQSTADVGLVTLGRGKGKTSVPSKVLAYMAAARPVIAAVDDDSDTAEWIREAECGWVVPAEDPQAMVDALLRAAGDPAAAAEKGRNGRRFLEQRLNRRKCTAEYERLLRGA